MTFYNRWRFKGHETNILRFFAPRDCTSHIIDRSHVHAHTAMLSRSPEVTGNIDDESHLLVFGSERRMS